MIAEDNDSQKMPPVNGSVSVVTDTQKWLALELAASNLAITELLANQEFRSGVMSLGREHESLSSNDRLSALILLLRLEKAGKEGKQLASAVFKPVISIPPAQLSIVLNEKDQLLFIQGLGKRAIEWLPRYLARNIWLSGIGKKAAAAAAISIIKKSANWASALEYLIDGGISVIAENRSFFSTENIQTILQAICSGIESGVGSPGREFLKQIDRFVDFLRQAREDTIRISISTKWVEQLLRLMRVAVQARPILLQQEGLSKVLQRIRETFPNSKWSTAVEPELKRLRNLVGDRIANDVAIGTANWDMFSALESMFDKRSEALAQTSKLTAFIPTGAGPLLEWLRTGELTEQNESSTVVDDDRLLAGLYVRSSVILEELEKGREVGDIRTIRAMCVEIEQMAQMHDLQLVWTIGDEVEYSPLTHRYIEGEKQGGAKAIVEAPAVKKRDQRDSAGKFILPAWVRPL